jgi:hypothetical protein
MYKHAISHSPPRCDDATVFRDDVTRYARIDYDVFRRENCPSLAGGQFFFSAYIVSKNVASVYNFRRFFCSLRRDLHRDYSDRRKNQHRHFNSFTMLFYARFCTTGPRTYAGA